MEKHMVPIHAYLRTCTYIFKHLPTWLHPVIINHHKPNLLWTHLQPATSHVRWHLSRHASSGSQSSIGPSVGGPKAPLWLEKNGFRNPLGSLKTGSSKSVIICYYMLLSLLSCFFLKKKYYPMCIYIYIGDWYRNWESRSFWRPVFHGTVNG